MLGNTSAPPPGRKRGEERMLELMGSKRGSLTAFRTAYTLDKRYTATQGLRHGDFVVFTASETNIRPWELFIKGSGSL
jgi:hypothetical protein